MHSSSESCCCLPVPLKNSSRSSSSLSLSVSATTTTAEEATHSTAVEKQTHTLPFDLFSLSLLSLSVQQLDISPHVIRPPPTEAEAAAAHLESFSFSISRPSFCDRCSTLNRRCRRRVCCGRGHQQHLHLHQHQQQRQHFLYFSFSLLTCDHVSAASCSLCQIMIMSLPPFFAATFFSSSAFPFQLGICRCCTLKAQPLRGSVDCCEGNRR